MVRKEITELIREALAELKMPEVEVEVEHPAEEEHGDYATNVALKVKSQKSKVKSKNPQELAETLANKLRSYKLQAIKKIEVAGPGFINFWLSEHYLSEKLGAIVQEGNRFGSSDWGRGKKWLVEHTSPNPNKAMHLGHLRNNVTGMAISRIWEFIGVDVVRDCIDNDRGIAIAKLMWGYLKFGHREGKEIVDIGYWYEHQDEWKTPSDLKMRPDRFVDQLYVSGSDDFKKNKETEQQVRQLVVDWEGEDKKTWALWRKVLAYSYEGQAMTLERLGNHWDKVWHEHQHYKQGKEIVEEGLQRGVFRQLKDGAILSDLHKFGLADTILIKSDGTALYITQDLALTKLKREAFRPDHLFWVIGPEQTLALKQLFAICEQLGIGKVSDYTHVSYGYMSVKGQGKMSSRAGTVVYIDELLDKTKAEIRQIIKDSKLPESEVEKISETVGVGAVKYSILRVGRMQDIAFDFRESVSLEGNSGPYIQYTFARARSVLRKSKVKSPSGPGQRQKSKVQLKGQNLKINEEERAILRWIYRFPEVVEQAGKEYAPNLVCNFIYELAQRYNGFYNKHSILQPQNEVKNSYSRASSLQGRQQAKANSRTKSLSEITEFRLELTAATAQVLKNGLSLLGIEAPETM